MKRRTKVLISALCVMLCAALAIASAPVSRAAGMMRLDIDNHVYTKVYSDIGTLALVGWTYDASEDTLRLKNFGSSDKPQTAIFAYPYSGTMTIELNGNNYIQASREMALTIIGHVKFTGTGSLTVICNDTYGINTDYTVTVSESASLNVTGLAGIMALKGMTIDTAGNVNIHTSRKCINTDGDVKIRKGKVDLSGTVGIYTTQGNIFMSGGETEVLINSTERALYLVNSDAYIEWSANAVVTAGNYAPGKYVSVYNNERYFRASFSGIPKLNAPRSIYWDDTVIDDAGTTNPVGRWSAVENATGYLVKLYFYNDVGFELKKTFTVTDALSCNFGGHFTTYGKYCFSVTALGDGVDSADSDESERTTEYYRFSGDIASRFYVTLPESDHFKIIPDSGSTVVYYGESYSFTVEVDPAYTQSEILVWANEQRVALRHGKYTIDSVTQNITIKIGDLSVNTYSVTFPEHEAYTVYLLPEYSTEVEYGENCAFSIELSDIYMQSQLVVKANGQTLVPKYGIIYTISNITEDCTVEISGLIRDSYDITYQHLDGTYITTQTVDHGFTTTAPQDEPVLADGLNFVGWAAADGTMFDFNTPINEAITLYARFEAEKADGYYLISTVEQFMWFRDEVNFGNNGISGKLCADLKMNEGQYIMVGGKPVFTENAVIWEPIGGYDYDDQDNYVKFFEGKFDGDGHTLSGFYIKHDKMAPEASDIGIFGIVSAEGSVKNLNVTDSVFDGYGNVGSVVGWSYAPVTGCTSNAILIGAEDVGGIVGEMSADISDCVFTGSVTVEQYSASSTAAPIGGVNAGGIVGKITEKSAAVSDCSSDGTVSSYKNAGGIAGLIEVSGVSFDNCVNGSGVSATDNAGGILGSSDAIAVFFDSVSNLGSISSQTNAGGIFAVCDAETENAVNTGTVSGDNYAGGIGAVGDLEITDSYNEANITSSKGTAAGFIASGDIEAQFCYNAGEITATKYAAGFAGECSTVTLDQVHNYGKITAATAGAFAANSQSENITDAYYRSEVSSSPDGFAATTEWFYCGYTSLLLNRGNDSNFWAQGKAYPVFSSDELAGYVLPFDGDGSELNPYLIMDEYDMRVLSALINNESGWSSLNYKLGADIFFVNPDTVNNFIPFGSTQNKFTGTFDGEEHILSGINFSINGNSVGLFREIGKTGTVKNLVLDNFTVNGQTNVAAVTGYNEGTVYNCDINNSEITGFENVASAVGYNFGNISYVNSDSKVYGTVVVGGIVGLHESGSFTSCFNSGDVTGIDSGSVKSTEIGGVAGKSFVLISYSGNSGSVFADTYAGGVIGANYGDMFSLYNGGNVTANEYSGAITALQESETDAVYCYYIGGTAPGGLTIGNSLAATNAYNGLAAYSLNNSGKDKHWAQGENHPRIAAEDGNDAVVFTVIFYSFDSMHYLAATMNGGCAVTPPEPEVDGYNFLYWDTPYDNVTRNMVTRAVFDRDYDITFIPTASVKTYSTEYDTFICGFSTSRKWTVADLDRQISNEKIAYMNFDMYEEYDTTQNLFTGMSVSLYAEEGVYYQTLWIVIFGDIDGDGDVDENDVVLLNLICNEVISIYELNYAQQEACDVNHDGVVDFDDVSYLEEYMLMNKSIVQSVSN